MMMSNQLHNPIEKIVGWLKNNEEIFKDRIDGMASFKSEKIRHVISFVFVHGRETTISI